MDPWVGTLSLVSLLAVGVLAYVDLARPGGEEAARWSDVRSGAEAMLKRLTDEFQVCDEQVTKARERSYERLLEALEVAELGDLQPILKDGLKPEEVNDRVVRLLRARVESARAVLTREPTPSYTKLAKQWLAPDRKSEATWEVLFGSKVPTPTSSRRVAPTALLALLACVAVAFTVVGAFQSWTKQEAPETETASSATDVSELVAACTTATSQVQQLQDALAPTRSPGEPAGASAGSAPDPCLCP